MPHPSDQKLEDRARQALAVGIAPYIIVIDQTETIRKEMTQKFNEVGIIDYSKYTYSAVYNRATYENINAYNAIIAKYNVFHKTYPTSADRPLTHDPKDYGYIIFNGVSSISNNGVSVWKLSGVDTSIDGTPPLIYTLSY